MTDFAFDIETTPTMDLVEQKFERQPFEDKPFDGSKWKTEAARERNREQHERQRGQRVRKHESAEDQRYQDLIRSSLVRAERASVLCIAYRWGENGDPGHWQTQHVVEWGPETELLTRLWYRCLMVQRQNGQIYTASGLQFDLRFCFRRSLINRVKFPAGLQLFSWRGGRGFPADYFVDVSEVWAAGEYQHRIKVDDLAQAFGFDGKLEGITGAEFYKCEDRQLQEEYALRDARIAFDIGKAMSKCGVRCLRQFEYEESV